jgi:predicted ATPase
MITKVKVSNFKSFDELEVELRPLNIVVGSNAAGKSNFLEIFRFIRDIEVEGLENAVSLQGGMEFLMNLQIGPSRPIAVELSFDPASELAREEFDCTRRLELIYRSQSPGFEIVSDESHSLTALTARNLIFLRPILGSIELFDLDPKLPKKAAPISGRAYLEPDGSNLALVLRNLLQNPEERAAFIRLTHDALPFIEDLEVERFADKSLLIAAKEIFSERVLPASFLSDGTIHLAALIVALYFHPASIAIIEEPERNIHPHLISKVVHMLADASQQKQVIVTTHNPELVKHADLADLLLVHRDEQGFSHVTRPAESAELKVFLENDLGVDELYVQNLLGVGHGV